ncbi:MAG: Nitroreductase family protein [Alphaproteobacteria bacterium ADurb.Bin438]|nr:MAG: Nitroreductase family protein [Alphaproteobacteria bacterium ADurb.Bin438]
MLIAYRRIGFDRLFLKAPHMIVVSAPKDSVYGEKDAMIALSYFELLANTMGIGTLWNGIVAMLYRLVMPEIKADLEIPEDHEIQYVMLFGRPAVKYKRGVNRPNENLNFLS